MIINFNNIDCFLENQHLFELEIVPQKNLTWQGKSFFTGCENGQISFNQVTMDATAHSDSVLYRLLIPLKEEPYFFNGDLINFPIMFTPNPGIQVIFPKQISNLHLGFSEEYFTKNAVKNQLFELIEKNQFFKYHDGHFFEFKKMIFQALREPEKVEHHLDQILDKYFEIHSTFEKSEVKQETRNLITNEIFPFMKDNIHKDLAITDICDFFSISRRSFENSFRYYFGMSPASYFKRLKLMHVRNDLIKFKYRNINEILLHYNINHAGHFGQFYKKICGETMTATVQKIG